MTESTHHDGSTEHQSAPSGVDHQSASRQKFLDDVHQSCQPSTFNTIGEYFKDTVQGAVTGLISGKVLPPYGPIIGAVTFGAVGAYDASVYLQQQAKACEYDKLQGLLIEDTKQ